LRRNGNFVNGLPAARARNANPAPKRKSGKLKVQAARAMTGRKKAQPAQKKSKNLKAETGEFQI